MYNSNNNNNNDDDDNNNNNNNTSNNNNNGDEISTDPPMDGSKEPKDNLKFQPLFVHRWIRIPFLSFPSTNPSYTFLFGKLLLPPCAVLLGRN